MKMRFFCPRWGSEALDWEVFLEKVKASGYDGVEWGIAGDIESALIDKVWGLAGKLDLLLIAQHYDTNHAHYQQHYDVYAKWLERIKSWPWVKINSQTGKDHFSFSQNEVLIGLAGNEVVHETHRGKFSFAAHVTAQYLQVIKELRITLDVSHWVNVAESFLEDQAAAMDLAIDRTEHIHARVGFTEGPQIPDPRAAEWQFAVERHLAWWDRVVARKYGEGGNALLTITPEFGPYPYLIRWPFPGNQVRDQWEMNEYMMNLLKKRYA